MTINKSQGQTLEKVGLFLQNLIFSHGQLYVAVSRATSRNGIKMLLYPQEGIPLNCTKNVVYQEVLDAINRSNPQC